MVSIGFGIRGPGRGGRGGFHFHHHPHQQFHFHSPPPYGPHGLAGFGPPPFTHELGSLGRGHRRGMGGRERDREGGEGCCRDSREGVVVVDSNSDSESDWEELSGSETIQEDSSSPFHSHGRDHQPKEGHHGPGRGRGGHGGGRHHHHHHHRFERAAHPRPRRFSAPPLDEGFEIFGVGGFQGAREGMHGAEFAHPPHPPHSHHHHHERHARGRRPHH